MIPRQVYRRGELKVDFPELNKVHFRTSKRNYGNRKNQGSPDFRVGSFAYPGSPERPKVTPPPIQPSLPKVPEPVDLEPLQAELRRKDEELRRLLVEPAPRAPTPLDPARSLSPLDLYRLGVQKHTPSLSPPKILSQSPFVYPVSVFRSPAYQGYQREPQSYSGLPRSYESRSPFYDRRALADYGQMLVR